MVGDLNNTNSTLIEPHNATKAQLKYPLLLDDEWGTEKCKSWITQDSKRCDSQNYLKLCAKSCMDYAHQALSVPQRTAEKSQAETLQAIQTAANHNAGTTSNGMLEHAYKILQEASESVTKLFNLNNALVVSAESPNQIRKSKILNERYQKAS